MVTLNKKESNRFIKKMLKKEKQPITKKDKELAKAIKKNMTKLSVTIEDEDKRRQKLADKYNPMLRVNGKLCSRCKKNKATVNYANSILDWNHGFGERICQTCYDKQKHENTWYKEGRKEVIQDEISFLKNMLQTKNQKELSKARTQDTGRNTIPDMYDMKIKERIKLLDSYIKE